MIRRAISKTERSSNHFLFNGFEPFSRSGPSFGHTYSKMYGSLEKPNSRQAETLPQLLMVLCDHGEKTEGKSKHDYLVTLILSGVRS